MEEILELYESKAVNDPGSIAYLDVQHLDIDRHVAASLLQKAIRRSETGLALAATKRLLDLEPARFWRRLTVTLFEDVGISDRDLALRVLAVTRRRRFRTADWLVVSGLIERLCDAPKTQIANHLIHLAQFDPDEFEPMDVFDCLSFSQASGWMEREHASLVQKCRAAWLLSGLETGRGGKPAAHPDADLERLLEVLRGQLESIELDLIAIEGVKCTRNPLPLAAVLEASQNHAPTSVQHTKTQPDHVPQARETIGLPDWIFDQHTRAGKRALVEAATACPTIRDVLTPVVNQPSKQRCLCSLHFEFEAARLANRLQQPEHLEAWRRVQIVGAYRSSKNAQALYEALETDWGRFEEIRSSMICETHRG